jgi:hypothetical protein
VVDVAPATVLHVRPALVDTRHWTVGVGEPDAAALNEAVDPAATLLLPGWVVIVGAADPWCPVGTADRADGFGATTACWGKPTTLWVSISRPGPRAGEALAATGMVKATTAATTVPTSPARAENRKKADAHNPCRKLTTR